MNRGMTLEEAIEILEEVKELDDTLYAYNAAYMEALEVALFALREIQNYRKLGTLEELARAKRYIDLAKKHGTIGEMIDECAEYEAIGTVEECRKAVEKQKAKKPDIYTDTRNMVDLHGNVYAEQANVYLCPTCESFIGYVGNNIFHYCPVCGQAIDENLEGMEDERD